LIVKFTEFSAAFDEQAGGARMRPWHTASPNMARPSVLGGIAMAINYTVGDNWGSGFTGSMTVPGGSQGLQGWTLEFDATFNITNIWNADIVSHVGNHYVIRSASWNASVPAGGQASFGFQATSGANGTTASGFTLNGATDAPPPPVLPTLSIADASIKESANGTCSRSSYRLAAPAAAATARRTSW
jgi:chitinase